MGLDLTALCAGPGWDGSLGGGRVRVTIGQPRLAPASPPRHSGRPKGTGELAFSSQTDEPSELHCSSATLFTARALVPGKRGKETAAPRP